MLLRLWNEATQQWEEVDVIKGDPGEDGSIVSVSATGTSIDEVKYITIDGVEKKLAGGSGSVLSVNGKTGAVVLDAEDVSALPSSTSIPTKTSDLTNDSGFLTQHQSLSAYRTAAAQDIIDAGKQNTLTAGANVSINANNVISATDTTYSEATTSASGLMSATDKTKLNGIAEGATANTGTVTSVAVKMNGSTKGNVTTSGEIDLGTVLTQHQSLSDYRTASAQDAIDAAQNAAINGKSIVSGVNDGTNWTSLTVNGTTKAIPAGGGAEYTAGEGIDITNNAISVISCNGYRFQYEREEPLNPQENVIYFIPISD